MGKCPRCGGPMFQRAVFVRQGTSWGLSCVMCGEFIDPVIIQNRQAAWAFRWRTETDRVKQTDGEFKPRYMRAAKKPKEQLEAARRERIADANEEAAIFYSF